MPHPLVFESAVDRSGKLNVSRSKEKKKYDQIQDLDNNQRKKTTLICFSSSNGAKERFLKAAKMRQSSFFINNRVIKVLKTKKGF